MTAWRGSEHTAYLPREQGNYGIRATSHVPVEATTPEPAHTIFFLIKHREGGKWGVRESISKSCGQITLAVWVTNDPSPEVWL